MVTCCAFSDSFQNVAPWDVSSNVSPRRSSSALQVRTRQFSSFPWRWVRLTCGGVVVVVQMKVMWDPYTGQFIDTGKPFLNSTLERE